MDIIFIIVALLIVFFIPFAIIKYLLRPLFFKPKLSQIEVIDFFEKQKLRFVDKRELNKGEKKLNPFNFKIGVSLKNIYLMRTEYIVVVFCESKKEYHFFWLELTQWYMYNMKFFLEFLTDEKVRKERELISKEIKEADVLKELKKNYEKKVKLIKENCPACLNPISDEIGECPNCELSLNA